MVKIVRPSAAKAVDPEFFARRPKDVNWTLRVTGDDGQVKELVGLDWEAVSRFGKVENVVVCDDTGKPIFDRPAYHEAPNVNVVAWGRDVRTGEIKVAVIIEERPHAQHPTSKSDASLKFGQIPMGFLEKLLGKDQLQLLELGKAGAIREVAEETGAAVVRGFSRPACPWHNPSPSFVVTWSDLYFIEVDLERIGQKKLDPDLSEMIVRAEYISIRELLARIREGQTDDGAIYRACTSLSAIMIFLACNPEFWPY